MPCTAPARGTKATVAIPPFSTPSSQPVPFQDAIDNTPCGRRIIATANGVAMSSHSLCLFHLMMKLGQAAVQPPYVDAA